ncbi:uncharacterized protein LOC110037949, partial [Phalaenopsis equestris]|uniref:uncharacterized protein LOC110037949 n=1 Tax=Phalaenopsis equestris TaxID=78828 RepID=UPI0009E47CEA
MVISAEKGEARRRNMAGLVEKPATLPPSSRSMPPSRLHNFSFPTLSWGNRKLLRCVNPSCSSMDDELQTGRRCSSNSSLNDLSPLRPPPPSFTVQKHGQEEEECKISRLSASKQWNLRSKGAARNAPVEILWNRNPSPPSQSSSPSYSPTQMEKTSSLVILVTRLEGLDMAEKSDRRKFSIALSREEIEEDFVAAKGTKPPRRPKKRAKYLQRQLDVLFPGILLSEVSSDLYKT